MWFRILKLAYVQTAKGCSLEGLQSKWYHTQQIVKESNQKKSMSSQPYAQMSDLFEFGAFLCVL